MVERVGAGIANLYLHDPEEGDLYLAASSLERSAFGEELRIAFGQGVDGEAARTKRPAFLRGAEGSLSYAALPLMAGDCLTGVLAIQSGNRACQGRGAEEVLQ